MEPRGDWQKPSQNQDAGPSGGDEYSPYVPGIF